MPRPIFRIENDLMRAKRELAAIDRYVEVHKEESLEMKIADLEKELAEARKTQYLSAENPSTVQLEAETRRNMPMFARLADRGWSVETSQGRKIAGGTEDEVKRVAKSIVEKGAEAFAVSPEGRKFKWVEGKPGRWIEQG